MDKIDLMKILLQLIQDISDRDEKWVKSLFVNKKVRFRQYPRLEMKEDTEVKCIDITIEI